MILLPELVLVVFSDLPLLLSLGYHLRSSNSLRVVLSVSLHLLVNFIVELLSLQLVSDQVLVVGVEEMMLLLLLRLSCVSLELLFVLG